MRLLVVEDDPKILSFLENGLRQDGYAVDTAEDGIEGLHLGASGRYDAAIIDIMLPGLDGLALIERMRERRVDTPVLILSAKREVDDRIKGLQVGGDDYMVKPFSFSEVLARIQALIRRSTRAEEPTSLTVGDLRMDLLQRKAWRGEVELDLRPREWALLEHLMRNAGRVVSKTSILERVYDYSFDPQTNVVDVLVHRLRASVDKEFEEKRIRTVRGVGYVLEA